MNKHTELPWINGWGNKGITGPNAARMLGWENKYPITIKRAWGNHPIAALPVSDEEHKANAAFIVKACNNHYRLLEALKEVTEELHQLCGDEVDDPSVGIVGWDFINEQIIPNAREAIKQAEEGEGEDDE